jgi:hypothetical protein
MVIEKLASNSLFAPTPETTHPFLLLGQRRGTTTP